MPFTENELYALVVDYIKKRVVELDFTSLLINNINIEQSTTAFFSENRNIVTYVLKSAKTKDITSIGESVITNIVHKFKRDRLGGCSGDSISTDT